MGDTLSREVDVLLKDVLEGGESTGTIGFLESNYEARGKSIRPIRLAKGLCLTGKIDRISVSSSTIAAGIGAAFSTFFGAPAEAPPISTEVCGLRVCISGEFPSGENAVAMGQQIAQANHHSVPTNIIKHIAKVTATVKDAVVELKLSDHTLLARIKHMEGTPLACGRHAAKWKIEHRGLQVELDGKPILTLPDAIDRVQLAEACRRLDIELHDKINLEVSVDQLLAILDVAASAVQIATAEQVATSAASSTHMPLGIQFQGDTRLHVDMFDSPLLEAKVAKGNVSIMPSSTTEVLLQSVEVRCGGEGSIEAQQVRFCSANCLEPLKIVHGFPSKAGNSNALPWAGSVDFLLDDPRFSQHRDWLKHAKGDGSDVIASSKRGREEENETATRKKMTR